MKYHGRSLKTFAITLTGEDEQKLAKRYSSDAEAYQLYLKGRYFWNKRNEEGFRNSIDYFKRAEEEIQHLRWRFPDSLIPMHCSATLASLVRLMKCQRQKLPHKRRSMQIRISLKLTRRARL